MSTGTESQTYKKLAMEIKSTSYSTPVLAISSSNLKQIEFLLEEKIALAPEFFKNSALLIDLYNCKDSSLFDLSTLIDFLYSKNIMPIGLRGGSSKQNTLALSFKIPIHTGRATTSTSNNVISFADKTPAKQEPIAAPPPPPQPEVTGTVENVLITQPVRSGQRIYARGDLTILAPVSAGAEILAEGNIQVYGPLRGRALAGVQGDVKSRIICSQLDAELISIAGNYKTNEELGSEHGTKPVQVFLQKNSLIIEPL
jgi:septum site-determining protein MinC